ncbi:GDP-mannose 4,6-dehydratase [Salinimicrobium tongyeongense]|uniref:GDP-mannose 4,6-dehydratase n=1 Tax=Salinimicrobium tongyeongense TaxID=2809707 RepID=UPI0022362977|nr:GDP-mannose 4,6-dehydratase [Salinimicrobium tongyeongense]
MMRKVAEAVDGGEIEVWGDGQQTRSFLHVDECVEALLRLMSSEFKGPVNIGSEEMVSINRLAQIAIDISGKNLSIKNLEGEEFSRKYGFVCPTGVRGRNSENSLYREQIGWEVNQSLEEGMKSTYEWIAKQVNSTRKKTVSK